jgi:hypothetical protein
VIHLIHNDPKIDKPLEQEDPNTMEMLNRTVAVALSATLERDLESRRRTNQMLDAFETVRHQTNIDVSRYLNGSARSSRVVVHQYRPQTVLGGKRGLLNFSRENIEGAIAAGQHDAAQHNCAASGCIL